MQFIHKKTGKRYWVINAQAKDCTNIRDGLAVVVYCRGDERDIPSKDWFVREASEFFEKFEPVESNSADGPDLSLEIRNLVQVGRDLGIVTTPSELNK